MKRTMVVPGLLTILGVLIAILFVSRFWGSNSRDLSSASPVQRLQFRGPVTPPFTAASSPAPLWQSTSSPNILLISVDTLRIDHLGCFGYARNTTPELDQLCRDSVVYDNAVVPIPKTTPSLTSLLSGLYPKTHRTLTLGIPVDSQVPFVSQLLQSRGYTTVGICGQFNCHRVFGFDRGFDTFDDTFAEEFRLGETHDLLGGVFHPEAERRAEDLVTSAIRWLDQPHDGPFFMWIHFMDPHAGYAPPPPFDTRFNTPPPNRERAIFGPHIPSALIHRQARVGEIDDYGFYLNRYDGEIRYFDSQLGRLLHHLRQREIYDETMVVFTSDHGEYMGESSHEFIVFSHGFTANESEVRAPLVIKLPDQVAAGTRNSTAVSTIDIAPTLVPGGGLFDGLPLPLEEETGRPQIIQFPKRQADFAVRHDGLKTVVRTRSDIWELIEDLRRGENIPVAAEMYDLAIDPWERHPTTSGEALSWSLDVLAQWLVQTPPVFIPTQATDPLISKATEEKLRSLGYVH